MLRTTKKLAAVGVLLLGASWTLWWGGPSQKVFVLSPNPPSAGSDVDVTYLGSGEVMFQIDDGESMEGKLDSKQHFRIPKKLLRPGGLLYLMEVREGTPHNVCIEIEP